MRGVVSPRIRHDAASIATVEGSLISWGATRRVAVDCGDTDALPTDELIRVVLDEHTFYALPQSRPGQVVITGVYDTSENVRDPRQATNRLVEWVEDRELAPGRTVYIDVVSEGFRYGIRAPGESQIYDSSGSGNSLSDIIDNL